MQVKRRGVLLAVAACLLSPRSLLAKTNDGQAVTLLFNQIRRAHGVGMMMADDQLEHMAQYQAHLMAGKGKLSHAIGWGNGFKARLRKAGVKGAAAENIAAGQQHFRAVFAAWMASPGHRRNMLDGRFSRYGLAYATSSTRPDYRYWAIVLGR